MFFNANPSISLDGALQAQYPGLLLGTGIVRDLSEKVKQQALEAERTATAKWLRRNYSLDRLKDEARCRAYRDFYWRMGIDPTKQRPAAEALARRVLRGDLLPRINPVVDAYNLASLKTLIAIGAYDLKRIGGALAFRFSREGELFEPLGGTREALRAGQVVLADDERIVHVYPYRDARPTSVSEATRGVLVLSAGVPGVLRGQVLEAVRLACENIVRICGGVMEGVSVVGEG